MDHLQAVQHGGMSTGSFLSSWLHVNFDYSTATTACQQGVAGAREDLMSDMTQQRELAGFKLLHAARA